MVSRAVWDRLLRCGGCVDVVCGLVLVARTQKGQERIETWARWLLREFSLTSSFPSQLSPTPTLTGCRPEP